MKEKKIKYGLVLLILTAMMAGCTEYIRTEVEKDIYVNKLEISAFVGDQIQLVASPTDGTMQYKWSSENPDIASVDGNGLVKILSEGNTNIIVSSGDISRQVPVIASVRIALVDVVLSETSLELLPGGRKTILVTNVPENANDLPAYNWYSENPDIVTVNEIGELTVVGEGMTNVVYQVGSIIRKVMQLIPVLSRDRISSRPPRHLKYLLLTLILVERDMHSMIMMRPTVPTATTAVRMETLPARLWMWRVMV